jgi:rod shape-determining protein MreD
MQIRDKNRSRRSYGVLALVCAILQLAVAPNIGFGVGRANVALVFAAIVALTTGGRTGVLAGFLSGLFFDLCSTGPIGLMASLFTLMCYLMGTEERNRLADEPAGSLVLFAVGSLVVIASYHLAMLLVGDSSSLVDALIVRTLPTYALTLIVYLIFAFFMSRDSSSLGSGSKLGSGGLATPSRHGKGNHLKLGKP